MNWLNFNTTNFLILLIFLSIVCYFIARFIQGDLSIESSELISENTYDVTKINIIGFEIPNGQLTKVVYKITYKSKRIKYVTKEYKH